MEQKQGVIHRWWHLVHWRRMLPLVAIVAVMVAIGLRYFWGVHTSLDLNAADEGMYVQRASQWLWQGAAIPREWGPLYHYWLAALIARWNPVIAFYLSIYITALVPPVLLALLVYRHTRQMLWALLMGVAWLVSWGNYGDWRVNHFLLLFVLALLLLLPKSLARRERLVWGSVQAWGAWLLAYIRPEMFLTAVVFFVWVVWELWQARRDVAVQKVWRWSAGAMVLLFVVGWATSPWHDPSRRMLVAFGQHFAVRWEARTGQSLDPYHKWAEVLQSQFGDVHSVLGALRSRPKLFVWFVAQNVSGWGVVFLERALPLPWHHVLDSKMRLLAATLIFAAVLLAWAWRQRARLQGQKAKLWWVFTLAAWALPAVVSSWLFYPRPHYQAVLLALTMAALGWLLARLCSCPKRLDFGLAAALAVVMLAFFPRPFDGAGEQPRLATVLLLRSAAQMQHAPLTVLTTDPGYMGFFYTEDVLDVTDVATARRNGSYPDSPDLLRPWPFPDEVARQWPWFVDFLGKFPQTDYQQVRLPDGSRWLSRVPLYP